MGHPQSDCCVPHSFRLLNHIHRFGQGSRTAANSKAYVLSSTSNPYIIRRFARLKRANSQLKTSPKRNIGEAEIRPRQNHPKNEFPWPTTGMKSVPMHIGAVTATPRRICAYRVYAASKFRIKKARRRVGIRSSPAINNSSIKSPKAHIPPDASTSPR